MVIRSIVHAGLRRFYQTGDPSGVPADAREKLRRQLSFLRGMGSVTELRALGLWKVHVMTGDRKGTWSLHVTRNWRLTFRLEDGDITEVNFEDYHH